MIRLTARFDQYAYSVPVEIDSELLNKGFEEGTWVAPGENGYNLPAAGAKAFMLISSKRAGRDQFAGKVGAPAQIYVGPFALSTNMIVPSDIVPGVALSVNKDGLLAKATDGQVVVAYAAGAVTADGFLPIITA